MKLFLGLNIIMVLTSCVSWWASTPENKDQDSAVVSPTAQQSDDKTSQTDVGKSNAAFASQSKPQDIEDEKESEKNITDQLGLSQARISERMAEIESELKRQKETIKLLERGLLTGIPPSELKASDAAEKKDTGATTAEEIEDVDDLLANSDSNALKSSLTSPVLDPELLAQTSFSRDGNDEKPSEQSLKAAMAKAQKQFQGGDFRRALAYFSEVSRTYGEQASGVAVRFWLGKCYSGLKDHANAKGEYEAYLSSSPMGSHAADARVELARTLSKMGLKERARSELKKVIKDFEGQEPAEIAAHELDTLQGAL
ncbi:MAG: tetratricopeptide repeat protein [bacterium]